MARKRRGGSLPGLIKALWTIISFLLEIIVGIASAIAGVIVHLCGGKASIKANKNPNNSFDNTASPTVKPATKNEKTSHSSPRTPIEQTKNMGGDNVKGPIQKNQLPNGRYVIGKDIPIGIYDLEVFHGSGIIKKLISVDSNENKAYENNYHELAGGSWESHFINVDCREGEILVIPNNMVVGISRSNKVVLDL